MSDDLIDRQAMLKHIEKVRQGALMIDDIRESNIIMLGMNLLEEAVRNQPSAQLERGKGKWIYYPKASGSISSTAVHFFPVCSECGREHPISNYCPNCGARMEVDNNG